MDFLGKASIVADQVVFGFLRRDNDYVAITNGESRRPIQVDPRSQGVALGSVFEGYVVKGDGCFWGAE